MATDHVLPRSPITPEGALSFATEVGSVARAAHQLDRLVARVQGRRLDTLTQRGVRFNQLLVDRSAFTALVARALGDASYRPSPALLAPAFIAGKWRPLVRLGAVDTLAHAVIASVLGEQLDRRLSPHVYSYRLRRSPWQALRRIARFVRDHRRERPDPRTRGLHVIRSDIAAFAPSIPLDDMSPLWPELRAWSGVEESSPHWAMLRAMVLQETFDAEGKPLARERGILFGAPTTNVIMNGYLMPLDEAFAKLGGLYARFGDDVLFAHEDAAIVRRARTMIDEVLAERGLIVSTEKLRILYWNGAARASDVFPEAEPVDKITFLGNSVGFDGTIALGPKKWTALLRDVRARVRRTASLLDTEDPDERANVLVAVVNDAFDPRSELGVRYRDLLADLVSDRHQLAQLDYLVALAIAEATSGVRGPRAFRYVPYGALRDDGLRSRVVARNRNR